MRVKRIFIYTGILFFLLAADGSAKGISVSGVTEDVDQYEPFKSIFTLPYFSEDVNNPDQVDVKFVVIDPEQGKIIVPAFCRSNIKRDEKSLWEVRFTPVKAGNYRTYLKAESKKFYEKSEIRNFKAKKGKGKGFLRGTRNNPFFLVYDSGEPFFGIGHNVAWVYSNSIQVFDRYFSKLEESGCNLTRVWLSTWSLAVEWDKLGEYNQEVSEKIDELVDILKKRNIYIILCLDTYGSLMEEDGSWGENKWDKNPYNAKNGGPCQTPEEFFTNPAAKNFYKNKLKYIISRWGYSPNILAFELWNEYNAPAEWVKEMAGYLRSINPHRQLVTTSLGYPYSENFNENDIWELKEIDMITIHAYGDSAENGAVQLLTRKARELSEKYKKPFIVSEFGIHWAKDDKYYDPESKGTALHNSLWATALSKSWGTAMNWWWEQYIRPKNMYPHYQALQKFLSGTDWNSKRVKYIDNGPITLKQPGNVEPGYRDVRLKPQNKWGKLDVNEFYILENGDLRDENLPAKYLYGMSKDDMRMDQIFYVEYPANGTFTVRVGTVSQDARLHIYLDGQEKLRKDFTTGEGEGPWKKSLYLKEYDIYQCVYDEDVSIKVPAGSHAIKLSNTGEDWFSIENMIFGNYINDSYADARCVSLLVGEDMLFWIQNKSSNWENTFNNIEPKPIKNAYFDVKMARDGIYTIEWWDTYKGEVVSKNKAEVKRKTLRIEIPQFTRDTACRVRK
ncbi:MAG: cellulase family glycosylhydrolase [Candidatus Omnitrophota bacterium]